MSASDTQNIKEMIISDYILILFHNYIILLVVN